MPDLESTLLTLQPALGLARHPWWVLGSAAVVMLSGKADAIRDVDVLLDPRDVDAVLERLGVVPLVTPPDPQFRSAVFARWTGGALPVELFAGFSLLEAGKWHSYVPRSRIELSLGAAGACVPDRREMIELLHRFGRPKDLARAATLT